MPKTAGMPLAKRAITVAEEASDTMSMMTRQIKKTNSSLKIRSQSAEAKTKPQTKKSMLPPVVVESGVAVVVVAEVAEAEEEEEQTVLSLNYGELVVDLVHRTEVALITTQPLIMDVSVVEQVLL